MLKKTGIIFILIQCVLCPLTLSGAEILNLVETGDTVKVAISLSGILLIPITDFAEFYDYGTGAGIDISIHNIISKNISCIISTNTYTFLSIDQDKSSLFSLVLAIHGGYTINVADDFWISPFLGFGYMLNMVSINGTKEYLFNPAIILQCFIEYEMDDQIHLYLTPGYSIYFESENQGQFLHMATGIKFPF